MGTSANEVTIYYELTVFDRVGNSTADIGYLFARETKTSEIPISSSCSGTTTASTNFSSPLNPLGWLLIIMTFRLKKIGI